MLEVLRIDHRTSPMCSLSLELVVNFNAVLLFAGALHKVALTKDGKKVITCSADFTARVFEVSNALQSCADRKCLLKGQKGRL